MSGQLPPPRNGTETYLAAVYDRLGQILDRLPDRSQPQHEMRVELREPMASGDDTPPPVVEQPLAEPAPAPARAPRKRQPKKADN